MTDKHRKRPRDPNQLGKFIIDVAPGEVDDRPPTPEEQGKDPAAVAMGQKGGRARRPATCYSLNYRRKSA